MHRVVGLVWSAAWRGVHQGVQAGGPAGADSQLARRRTQAQGGRRAANRQQRWRLHPSLHKQHAGTHRCRERRQQQQSFIAIAQHSGQQHSPGVGAAPVRNPTGATARRTVPPPPSSTHLFAMASSHIPRSCSDSRSSTAATSASLGQYLRLAVSVAAGSPASGVAGPRPSRALPLLLLASSSSPGVTSFLPGSEKRTIAGDEQPGRRGKLLQAQQNRRQMQCCDACANGRPGFARQARA